MKVVQAQLQSILPMHLRSLLPAENIESLTEIRLRLSYPMQLIYLNKTAEVGKPVSLDDLNFCVNTASRYSPWNAASMKQGYLTAPGGHRIGVCGETAGEGIRSLTSVCIRVAKDLQGISDQMPIRDSILIIGPPGSGKTTLLRDYIRRISAKCKSSVCVVDERCEIFPFSCGSPCFNPGKQTDILSGCSKERGINHVIRSMGPAWVALDEITDAKDCDAMVQALWCGVKVIATAHASSVNDLLLRPVYQPIVNSKVFSTVAVMHPDKSYHLERISR